MYLVRATVGMAVLLVAVNAVEAGEWGPNFGMLQAIRDMRLTLRARSELGKDPELRRLGVEVKNGIAYIWGPVSDQMMERRAVSRLELIVGIEDIKPDCYYTRRVVVSPPTPTPTPPSPPPDREMAYLPGVPTPPVETVPVPGVPEKPPSTVTKVSRVPVLSLAEQVEALKKKNPLFASVEYRITGTEVEVKRGDDEEIASLFAQRVGKLPGVSESVLEP